MKKIFKRVFSFIFIILFSFTSFIACSAPGASNDGPGYTVNPDKSGQGGNNTTYDDVKSQFENEGNPDNQFETLFQGVYVICEADDSTKFYDDVTKSNKNFDFLLERQYETLAEYLVYALTVIYGDSHTKTKTLTQFSNAVVNDFEVIGIAKSRDTSCGKHTGNKINIGCSECLAKIANLRKEFKNNPFNFKNAIAGGYEYDSSSASFTSNINSNSSAWVSGTTLNVTTIKEALVRGLATGDFTSTISYDDAKLKIDHLGFTKSIQVGDKTTLSEVSLIKEYILKNIIGDTLVKTDNTIRNNLGGSTATIEVGDSAGIDIFAPETTKHYYKAYEDVVNLIVDKAMDLGIDGSFKEQDGDKQGTFENDTLTIFPQMPRIVVEYYPANKFCSKSVGTPYEDDDSMSEEELKKALEEYGNTALKDVMKNAKKVLSVIALPSLSDEAMKSRRKFISGKYNEEVAKEWESIGGMNSILLDQFALGVNGDKNTNGKYIVKPRFYAKAQGNVILDSYIKNSDYRDVSDQFEEKDIYQYSEDEILVQYHERKIIYDDLYKYSAVANYNLSSAVDKYIEEKEIESKRMLEYDGVSLVSKLGFYNKTYFNGKVQKVWADIFDIQGKYNQDNLSEFISGVNAVFKGGDNFLQVSFEYYNEAKETIKAVPINFFYFNSFY